MTSVSPAPAPIAANATGANSIHPLNRKWEIFYDRRPPKQSQPQQQTVTNFDEYTEKLKSISKISSVEEFWTVFNYIPIPSEIADNSSLYFFHEGITPAWESIPAGGIWTFSTKTYDNTLIQYNDSWQNIILGLIGEQLPEESLADHICGIELTVKKTKYSKLALWMDTTEEEVCMDVGKWFAELIPRIGYNSKVAFKSNDDLIKGGRSEPKYLISNN